MKKKRPGRGVDATGRSKGGERFAAITYAMLDSPAWLSLSPVAFKAYMLLRRAYDGTNNGNLFLSTNRASAMLGISKTTAQRAFLELLEKGFLVKRSQGSWYSKRATTYAVTDFLAHDDAARCAWRKWVPQEVSPSIPHGRLYVVRESSQSAAENGPHGYCGGPSAPPNVVPLVSTRTQVGPPGYRDSDFSAPTKGKTA